MAKEYIEREALHEAMKYVYQDSTCPMHIAAEVDQYITETPAADVVEVVRCKDCEYRHDSCFAGVGNTYCDFHHKYFPIDSFCSYGERRDNNATD